MRRAGGDFDSRGGEGLVDGPHPDVVGAVVVDDGAAEGGAGVEGSSVVEMGVVVGVVFCAVGSGEDGGLEGGGDEDEFGEHFCWFIGWFLWGLFGLVGYGNDGGYTGVVWVRMSG